jgi:hypothetical protein
MAFWEGFRNLGYTKFSEHKIIIINYFGNGFRNIDSLDISLLSD